MIKIKKSLGQNFLVDKNKIREIIKVIPNINDKNVFLELGPGKGALTKEILLKGNQLIAIEIDKELIDYLKNNLDNKNLYLIHDDFLKIDLEKLLKKYKEVNFVSNLPYYISTKIIFKILQIDKINNLSIMLQKEIVDRIEAKPKTKSYGRLSVSINTFFSIKKVIKVSKNSFFPSPKIDSKFIVLEKRNINIDKEKYLAFIKQAFANKRKTLLNSLKANETFFEKIKEFIIKENLDPKVRAEEISINTFLSMWDYINNKL